MFVPKATPILIIIFRHIPLKSMPRILIDCSSFFPRSFGSVIFDSALIIILCRKRTYNFSGNRHSSNKGFIVQVREVGCKYPTIVTYVFPKKLLYAVSLHGLFAVYTVVFLVYGYH
ncbi:hypothetical protein F5890DRAFT_1547909, partial [Lentinula detonsa]